MSNQITITTYYAVLFLVIFGVGEFLFHKLKVRGEVTRKFVHVCTGLICLTFPFWISSHWSVLFLTTSFTVILITSLRFNFLKSINTVDRSTLGSYLFPISIYLLYWSYSIFGYENFSGVDLNWNAQISVGGILSNSAAIYYFLPTLIFTFSDPAAALVGQRWPFGKYAIFKETKTLTGSIAFFIPAFFLSVTFLSFQFDSFKHVLVMAALIGAITTITEAFSQKGTDNLLIPISTVISLYSIFNL